MINIFRELIENFSEFWILCTAIEVGVFEKLGKGPGSIESIAEAGQDKGVLEALCNCLVAYKHLEKDGERFSLTEDSRRCLLKGSGEYVGFFAESARVFDVLSGYTSFIRDGKRPQFPEKWSAITKMSALAGEGVPEFLTEKMPLLKDQDCSVLDLGCGRMMESVLLAASNPRMRVTGIETDRAVIEEVEAGLRGEGLGGRVRIQEGDAGSFFIKERFDVVFLNHLLHCLPHETNIRMLRNVKSMLRKGGRVVVFDDLLDDSKVSPREGVRKNLLARVFDSRVYSVSELKELLGNAGFVGIEIAPWKRRVIVIGRME